VFLRWRNSLLWLSSALPYCLPDFCCWTSLYVFLSFRFFCRLRTLPCGTTTHAFDVTVIFCADVTAPASWPRMCWGSFFTQSKNVLRPGKCPVLSRRGGLPCLLFLAVCCIYSVERVRVATRYWKYWKSIEMWNRFSKPWKGIEFGWNGDEVLKRYGNCKFRHLFIQFCTLLLTTVCRCFWIFVFREKNFGKMKISGGTEVFSCSIKKVLKKYGKCFLKMCGNYGRVFRLGSLFFKPHFQTLSFVAESRWVWQRKKCNGFESAKVISRALFFARISSNGVELPSRRGGLVATTPSCFFM